MDVKTLEDVSRAVRYHTAASSSVLWIYVDTDDQQSDLTNLIRSTLAPVVVRPKAPTPSTESQLHDASTITHTHPQQGHDEDEDAVTADSAVDEHSVDEAYLTRVFDERQQIRAAPTASTQPVTTVSPPPVPTPTSSSPPPSPSAIADRLQQLGEFTHARDVERAQRDRLVAVDDLTLRFHALKNERTTASSEGSLQERLQRLRGDADGPQCASVRPATARLSPVEMIIQQAMDEVAMGLVDSEDDEEQSVDDDALVSTSDDSNSSRSSDSDSDSEPKSKQK